MRTKNSWDAVWQARRDQIRAFESDDPDAQATFGPWMEEIPDPNVDVHEAAVTNIEAARVRRFVRTLPILERKVIIARYGLDGHPMSCRQLAARLGISKTTVSEIEQRALDRLRGMYELPNAA